MDAHDVMTQEVVTVSPDTDVRETAKLLVDHRISAVPVVDASGKLVGIVSENDLMRRSESGTERHPSWWLSLFIQPEQQTHSYVKAHGHRASDVMTRNVVTVAEQAPLEKIADLLEKHRIKRVPVVRDGRIIGIVSRADLLHGLIARQAGHTPSADDRTIRAAILGGLRDAAIPQTLLSVVVTAGVVHIWGVVDTEEQREAARIAIEDAPGVQKTEFEVNVLPRSARAVMID